MQSPQGNAAASESEGKQPPKANTGRQPKSDSSRTGAAATTTAVAGPGAVARADVVTGKNAAKKSPALIANQKLSDVPPPVPELNVNATATTTAGVKLMTRGKNGGGSVVLGQGIGGGAGSGKEHARDALASPSLAAAAIPNLTVPNHNLTANGRKFTVGASAGSKLGGGNSQAGKSREQGQGQGQGQGPAASVPVWTVEYATAYISHRWPNRGAEFPSRPGKAFCMRYTRFGECDNGQRCHLHHPQRGRSTDDGLCDEASSVLGDVPLANALKLALAINNAFKDSQFLLQRDACWKRCQQQQQTGDSGSLGVGGGGGVGDNLLAEFKAACICLVQACLVVISRPWSSAQARKSYGLETVLLKAVVPRVESGINGNVFCMVSAGVKRDAFYEDIRKIFSPLRAAALVREGELLRDMRAKIPTPLILCDGRTAGAGAAGGGDGSGGVGTDDDLVGKVASLSLATTSGGSGGGDAEYQRRAALGLHRSLIKHSKHCLESMCSTAATRDAVLLDLREILCTPYVIKQKAPPSRGGSAGESEHCYRIDTLLWPFGSSANTVGTLNSDLDVSMEVSVVKAVRRRPADTDTAAATTAAAAETTGTVLATAEHEVGSSSSSSSSGGGPGPAEDYEEAGERWEVGNDPWDAMKPSDALLNAMHALGIHEDEDKDGDGDDHTTEGAETGAGAGTGADLLSKVEGEGKGEETRNAKKFSLREYVSTARVPVLKLKHIASGIDIDIIVGSSNDKVLLNTQLLRDYACSDPRAHPLLFAVKRWASARNLSNSRNGTLATYSWMIMVIFFLLAEKEKEQEKEREMEMEKDSANSAAEGAAAALGVTQLQGTTRTRSKNGRTAAAAEEEEESYTLRPPPASLAAIYAPLAEREKLKVLDPQPENQNLVQLFSRFFAFYGTEAPGSFGTFEHVLSLRLGKRIVKRAVAGTDAEQTLAAAAAESGDSSFLDTAPTAAGDSEAPSSPAGESSPGPATPTRAPKKGALSPPSTPTLTPGKEGGRAAAGAAEVGEVLRTPDKRGAKGGLVADSNVMWRLSIEDPFELEHDLGNVIRSELGQAHILAEMRRVIAILHQHLVEGLGAEASSQKGQEKEKEEENVFDVICEVNESPPDLTFPCHLCFSMDHNFNTCPRLVCFNCGAKGHLTPHCKLKRSRDGPVKVFNVAADAPLPRAAQNQQRNKSNAKFNNGRRGGGGGGGGK